MFMAIFFWGMVWVEPNKYLSDLSYSSEGSLGRIEESETSSRSTRARSTRCQKIRRKFNKRMKCFLKWGGSCSYDDETVGDIDMPLRYKHLVKQWVPSTSGKWEISDQKNDQNPHINDHFWFGDRWCNLRSFITRPKLVIFILVIYSLSVGH